MVLGTFRFHCPRTCPTRWVSSAGQSLDAFGNHINNTNEMVNALKKVVPYVWYMAFATFPAGILEIGCWMYSSERQVTRLRLTFESCPEQEIGAFDTDLTSGKIISGISSHMSIIQDAIVRTFLIMLRHLLLRRLDCFHFLLGSVTSSIICCPNDSCNWGYLYKENECYFSNKDVIPVGGYCNGRTVNFPQKTVFAFVGENSAIKSFLECLARQLHMSKNEAFVKGFGTGMFQIVTFCSWALIVFVGAIVVVAGRAHGGDVIAAVMSILFGAISLTYAAPDMQIFNQAKAAGKEVFQVIERKPMIYTNTEGKILELVNGCIDIYDVHFAYPSRKETLILQGFTLSIPAGKVVALVGSSGCGKSTIMSLITRFYDPIKGDILIDNHSIKDLELKFLRRNIGLVSQEPSLFSGNIEDNIKAGNSNADDAQIQKAAQMANAHSFISQFPEQYLTEVGQRGVQLSGGQKQRIAIARAILKNPPILLLDEATSALDTESERVVQAALETAMQGRTVILIAHRLSTIVNADMIAVVENGIVTETGTHQDLLTNNKFYHNLFELQNISQESYTRVEDSMEEVASIQTDISSQFLDQPDEPREVSKTPQTTLKKGEMKESAILRNELAWFEKPENSVGSLTSRVINETSTVKTIISDRMSVIVQCISSIVIATIVSIKVNWRMGLVAWAVMPCHFIGGLIQAKSAKGFSSGSSAAYSELVALASESASNIKTIASFCQEDHVIMKAKVTLKKPLMQSRKQSVKYGIIQGVSLCLWNIAHAVALCLKIEAGSKVALVGPSGAGKSSVLALLLRFYDVNGGEVLIDGKDIKRFNLRKLRTQIGLVQQEPLLFSCSIRDNICYGNEGASEAEIIQAAMDANIHEVISNLPRDMIPRWGKRDANFQVDKSKE
ncbi:ABC transporter B family member 19 [Sesamum angolense]|uniref:ABC transporter B family member 19 n=1 Tax=Sesamum angolense TaxID=2727404 RepID=A0AAE1T420_9LAMI|nr:ABC transporter B family member 19 [Sesamum angolense]